MTSPSAEALLPPGAAERHPASYRDPASTVFTAGGRILRGLSAEGHERYRAARASGLLDALVERGALVGTHDRPESLADAALARFAHVVEHEAIPFVSYPYEWPFALLRAAALLHLDVHLGALERGMTLSDASAYNIQFRGAQPVFIDVGSFRPYEEGELWSAHRQFCEHFLNPLLLTAERGVPYNAWLRGSLEGVPTEALAALLPATRWLSLRHVLHVLAPARAERKARGSEQGAAARIHRARLPREAFGMMLRQLRRWIEGLAPRGIAQTTWADYGSTRGYESAELAATRSAVEAFAARHRPRMLLDLGCNDGEFAQAALAAGAQRVVGCDLDAGALDRACERARRERLAFLPLYQDAVDPSPSLGWRGRERASFFERAQADAMTALAFEHHVALGRNVPLDQTVDFLVGLAPRGLVEFVPKNDPTVQRMLALKGDLFPDYREEAFAHAMATRARIVARTPVSAAGRVLYEFER